MIDWLIISVYPAALVPVGLLLASHSVHLSSWGWNAVAFVILIVPVTVWLAAWESNGATPGKRALGLRVRSPREEGTGWRRASAILAYAILGAYLVSLFIRSGRTPYDRATATYVAQRAARA
jgi:uncharacterized RDD family membrane protein YckC